jgi:hypothetical protein
MNKDKMAIIDLMLGVFFMLLLLTHYSYAQSVGMISNIEGDSVVLIDNKRHIDFGDDIILKDKIKVGLNSSVMLTYYSGCRQEWFGENTVLEIGLKKSKVIRGQIQKSQIFDCEIPNVSLGENDRFKGTVYKYRGVSPVNIAPAVPLKNKIKVKSRRVDNQPYHSNDVKLKIWTAKKEELYYRSGEHIIIYLIANKDAYLKLDYFQADDHVVHLIPNIFEEKAKIKAGQIYVIGGSKSKLKLVVENPYGEESIHALVSVSPLENGLNSSDIIELSSTYQQKLKQLLLSDKQNKISEYALDIWSMP